MQAVDRRSDRLPWRPVAFFILIFVGNTVLADGSAQPRPPGGETNYAEALVAQAEGLRLYADPTWHSLLHYKPALLGGYVSLVDDPRFFSAPDGKFNPRHELAATLRAFFRPAGTNELEHPVCRFVARYTWLREKLTIDPAQLPVPECAKFNLVSYYLDVTHVTLVFPAAYMNGPASMFGHTLLVFDSREKNRLLAKSVSYAAKVNTSFGPLFAFAGMAGMYPGFYSIQPYYEKVEQYGDIGHRDVWEYNLDFSSNEVERMIGHAWELQNIWSRYFFFSENCAYNLYFLLEVARPELGLSDVHDWFVIPIDTVKAIDGRGLVTDVQYRPSQVTRIRHLAKQLDAPERALARRVARGQTNVADLAMTVPDPTNRAVVLELASEYIQYLYTEEKLAKARYSPMLMDTLRARSKLGALPVEANTIPPPPRPDHGHAPMRLSTGVGVREDDVFASLRGRIAYHALLDNDAGYEKGAEIQFLSTETRYDFERDYFRLQRLDVVHVESIAARDDFFAPGSWKFSAGAEQADRGEAGDRLVLQAQTGAGLAAESRGGALGYGWVEARGLAGPRLGDEDYAIGMGPAVGVMAMVGPRWKHLIEARATYYALGVEFWDIALTWGQDFSLTPNRSISMELSTVRRDAYEFQEAHVRVNLYF